MFFVAPDIEAEELPMKGLHRERQPAAVSRAVAAQSCCHERGDAHVRRPGSERLGGSDEQRLDVRSRTGAEADLRDCRCLHGRAAGRRQSAGRRLRRRGRERRDAAAHRAGVQLRGDHLRAASGGRAEDGARADLHADGGVSFRRPSERRDGLRSRPARGRLRQGRRRRARLRGARGRRPRVGRAERERTSRWRDAVRARGVLDAAPGALRRGARGLPRPARRRHRRVRARADRRERRPAVRVRPTDDALRAEDGVAGPRALEADARRDERHGPLLREHGRQLLPRAHVLPARGGRRRGRRDGERERRPRRPPRGDAAGLPRGRHDDVRAPPPPLPTGPPPPTRPRALAGSS